VLHPLFRSYTVPENSDYFPYLDERATRARFLRRSADGLNALRTSALPLVEMLESRQRKYSETRIAQATFVHRAVATRDAVAAYRVLLGDKPSEGLLRETRMDLAIIASYCDNRNLFDERTALNAFIGVAVSMVPYLTQKESWQGLSPSLQGKCVTRMGETASTVSELIKFVIERDGKGMRAKGEVLLEKLPKEADVRLLKLALDSAMVGSIVNGAPENAHRLWQKYGQRVQANKTIPIENRLMLSVAEVRMKQR
jgi:spermidine synthase